MCLNCISIHVLPVMLMSEYILGTVSILYTVPKLHFVVFQLGVCDHPSNLGTHYLCFLRLALSFLFRISLVNGQTGAVLQEGAYQVVSIATPVGVFKHLYVFCAIESR